MLRPAVVTFAVAIPLAWLFWLSGALPFPVALAALSLFVFVVMSAGFLGLRVAGAADMPAPAAWVLGIFTTALAVYGLVAAFHLLAATAFAIWAVAVAGLNVLLRRVAPPVARGVEHTELLALLLCAAATAYWCGDLSEVPQALAREGWLTTWTDQFGHGSVISQFGDPRAAGREGILLAGVPAGWYHYASFVLPAAFAQPLDLPGLPLATSLWVPMGFLTLCAGAYALGAALAGPAGGIAALVALSALPDPSSYGLHYPFFGYYWYVIAVPTASYAVGICLLAIALLRRWSKTGDVRPLAASALLIAGTLLFRLHIFVLAFPAWLTCTAMAARIFQGRRLAVLALAMAGFALFVPAYYWFYPDASRALWEFLYQVRTYQDAWAYQDQHDWLLAVYGPGIAFLGALAPLLPACLGVFFLLYPLSVLLAHRSHGLRSIDLFPAALLGWYILIVLTAPIPTFNGDASELTQRPFVLLYATIAVWTSAGFAGWMAAHGGISARRMRIALMVAAAVAVALALRYSTRDPRWGYSYEVADGLPRAATFLRSNFRPGDVLAAPLDLQFANQDLAMQLVSLTGMPAYLSVPWVQARRPAPAGQIVLQRYAALDEVAREKTASAALAQLRRLGIQWYVVAGSPQWDPERRRAAFVDGTVAVYSTR
jgi:hypothetical protein